MLIAVVAGVVLRASAQQSTTDPNPAVNNPDKFAWDVFIEVNRPALSGRRGIPDPGRRHGDEGPRVWETWKITTRNGNEVFLEGGRNPGEWDDQQFRSLSRPQKVLSPPKIFTILGQDNPDLGRFAATTVPTLTNGQESRINRAGFEFIVKEGLYSLDGQERFRATGRRVEFPIGTINVKATWREFTSEEIRAGIPSHYYTAEGDGKVLGLTGFHITTKDLPNWFWATFEHSENPAPEIPDRDRYTRFRYPRDPNAAYVQQRLREVPEPLKNTVFQYYVLRGTQVDFVDSMGNPTILGNTQLENAMQTSSSCLGCHARATIGDRMDNIVINNRPLYPTGTYFFPEGRMSGFGPTRLANRLTVNPAQVWWRQNPQNPAQPGDDPNDSIHITGATGAPRAELFVDAAGRSRYTQLDFIWGFIHAHREAR